MTPAVELIFDAACPNVDAARLHLGQALIQVGLPARWTEWDRAAPDVPAHARRHASPTVLVNGHDVAAGSELDSGDGCRVYSDADGALRGAPGVETILAALTAHGIAPT
jgi:hypothetical protein